MTEDQKLECWVRDYLEHLRAVGYALSTISVFESRLLDLRAFLRDREMDVEELGAAATLNAYLEHWRDNTPGKFLPMPDTRRQARSIIRRFVKWARQEKSLPPLAEDSPPKLLTGYLEFLEQHRGASPATIQNYRGYLTRLVTFLDQRGERELMGIPLEVFDEYIAHRGKTLGRGGLRILVTALRGFLKYLFFIGAEPEDRSDWLDLPIKFAKMKLPRDIEDWHLAEALQSVNRSTLIGKRDWAILMVLTHYGLRIEEVATIRLSDLDFKNGHFEVRRSKRGPRQLLPLLPVVAIAFKEYLSVRPESQHSEVFLRAKAPIRPLSINRISCRVHEILSSVPGAPRRSAHALRHTLARKMREKGEPLPVISQLLGHRDLDSAEAYIRISIEELREVADNYAELL